MLHFIARHSPEMLFEQTPHGETPGPLGRSTGRHTECILFLATHSLSHVFARDADGWTLAHSASCYGRFETLVALARAAPSLFGIRTHAGALPSLRPCLLPRRRPCTRRGGFGSLLRPARDLPRPGRDAPLAGWRRARAAVLLVEHLEGTCTSPPGAKPGLDSAGAAAAVAAAARSRPPPPRAPRPPKSPDSRATAAGGEPAGGFPAGQRAEGERGGGQRGARGGRERGARAKARAGARALRPPTAQTVRRAAAARRRGTAAARTERTRRGRRSSTRRDGSRT